jgi:hypothetical protein
MGAVIAFGVIVALFLAFSAAERWIRFIKWIRRKAGANPENASRRGGKKMPKVE